MTNMLAFARKPGETIAQVKQRTRCSVCDQLGHWAGDPQCSAVHKNLNKAGSNVSEVQHGVMEHNVAMAQPPQMMAYAAQAVSPDDPKFDPLRAPAPTAGHKFILTGLPVQGTHQTTHLGKYFGPQ